MSRPIEHVAVIGARGMLGRAWCELLARRGVDAAPLDLPEFDMTDPAALAAAVTGGGQLVVNCAAWTDVDGAEAREADALRLNGEAVARLAERCAAVGATILHYSTDYVFDGRATDPYPVDHPRDPVNAYGRTKLAGEIALERSGAEYLLIRTSWLYAPWAKNFVRTMARLGAERPTLRVVHDQRGRPTSAEHLAATSWRLAERGCRGPFHVCDGGSCTWFEFARAIVNATHPGCNVQPCTTADFPTPAKRPAYSVLDLSGTEAAAGPMPAWQDNLADVLNRLEKGG